MDKKGFVGLWADIFKGFFFGLIAGIVLVVLIIYEVIPFPFNLCGC